MPPWRELLTVDDIQHRPFPSPHLKLLCIKETRSLWNIIDTLPSDHPEREAARHRLLEITDSQNASGIMDYRPTPPTAPRATLTRRGHFEHGPQQYDRADAGLSYSRLNEDHEQRSDQRPATSRTSNVLLKQGNDREWTHDAYTRSIPDTSGPSASQRSVPPTLSSDLPVESLNIIEDVHKHLNGLHQTIAQRDNDISSLKSTIKANAPGPCNAIAKERGRTISDLNDQLHDIRQAIIKVCGNPAMPINDLVSTVIAQLTDKTRIIKELETRNRGLQDMIPRGSEGDDANDRQVPAQSDLQRQIHGLLSSKRKLQYSVEMLSKGRSSASRVETHLRSTIDDQKKTISQQTLRIDTLETQLMASKARANDLVMELRAARGASELFLFGALAGGENSVVQGSAAGQLGGQPTGQSIGQSLEQPMEQTIGQSMEQPTAQPVEPAADQPSEQPERQPNEQPKGWHLDHPRAPSSQQLSEAREADDKRRRLRQRYAAARLAHMLSRSPSASSDRPSSSAPAEIPSEPQAPEHEAEGSIGSFAADGTYQPSAELERRTSGPDFKGSHLGYLWQRDSEIARTQQHFNMPLSKYAKSMLQTNKRMADQAFPAEEEGSSQPPRKTRSVRPAASDLL